MVEGGAGKANGAAFGSEIRLIVTRSYRQRLITRVIGGSSLECGVGIMRVRPFVKASVCISLMCLLAAANGCGDETTNSTGGPSSTTSSSTSSTGSTMTSSGMGGEAGAGGVNQGGGGAMNQGGGGAMNQGGGGSMNQGGAGGSTMPVEICNNMADDDNDGMTDCADADCAANPACIEDCDNMADDDADGMADCADPDCSSAAVCGKLLINEVDYDQLNADTAEFVELFNAGTTTIDLSTVQLIRVNGSNAAAPVVYGMPVGMSGMLNPGAYVVITSGTVPNIDPAATVFPFPDPNAAGDLQNGGTIATPTADGIALMDAKENVLLDALSYEGPITQVMIGNLTVSLVSGNPIAVTDSPTPLLSTASLIRFANGQDTGDDAADWTGTTMTTPGSANQKSAEVCNTMADEDFDTQIDCADSDCTADPACTVPEICDNTLDDDGDMMIDCADMDCDMKACGSFGVVCLGGACVCPSGAMMETSCTDMLDEDCDGNADCADADCVMDPACKPVELCANGMDDDGDMMIDCADMMDCDTKACGAFGQLCTGGMCVCPSGMMTEMNCTDMIDDDCDGQLDCKDSDCSGNPLCPAGTITSVNYPVITHGGTLVITGTGFTGATTVTIGGVSQMFTVDSDTQITIALVSDGAPLGPQGVIVTTAQGSTAPFGVTVIHLLINEVDSDTPTMPVNDDHEFVEISTGVPNVSLAGYTLVHYNGTGDVVLWALDLNAVTDANGLLLIGNPAVMPAPAITFAVNTLQNGADAVAVYQTAAGNFSVGGAITSANLIDAVVYDTADADDAGLLDALLAPVGDPARVQVDEAVNLASATESVQRCGDGRRNGARFAVGGPPTPGAVNNVMACP